MRSIHPVVRACGVVYRRAGLLYLPTANQIATQTTPRKAAVPPKTAHCRESGTPRRFVMNTVMGLATGAGASCGSGTRSGEGEASGRGAGGGGGGGAWLDAASATIPAAAQRLS